MNVFLLQLCGCLVCGLGVWTLTDKWCFLYLMDVKTYKMTAWLLACTGMVSIVTAILGYTAVICESKCLLGAVSGI